MDKAADKKEKIALIVDDYFLIRRLHKEILGKMDISVVEASDGKEGLNKLKEYTPEHFSIIILDLIMPELNGVEFIMQAQKDYPGKLPKILVCSGKTDLPLIKKLIKTGIKGYLLKPVNAAQYTRKIKEIFPDVSVVGE